MYLIILEGTDNIGKDTIKNKLIDLFDETTVIHCHGPKAKIFANYEQDKKFINYANNIVDEKYDSTQCVIMNRSHYGEYVYGQLYRHRNVEDILDMLNIVDYILNNRQDLVVKYVQLYSSSIKLRIDNEDNKSLSKLDHELMEKENDLFKEVYEYSKFDKVMIDVNDGTDHFRQIEDIYNDVVKFIEK